MTSNPDVLIVGAGPTGLALAAALSRRKVTVRLIEKDRTRSDKSKALGIHAGTLESIDQMLGEAVSKDLLSAGYAAKKMFLHLQQNDPIEADLSLIPGKYNHVLFLPQHETEAILEKQSQFPVERGKSLESWELSPSRVRCMIKTDQGPETISARYVVGCDGAHSVVREKASIPFEGKSYQGDFVLGDVRIEWPWPSGDVRTFVATSGVAACFPLRGEKRYRVILIPRGESTDQREISWEDFTELAHTILPGEVECSDPVWLSRFRVHHRMVSRFRAGPVFLAGDAAHIHSPAGGQGMNTGIQDAFNLAHKLGEVIEGRAPESLLEKYEKERKPVAKGVLFGTDLAMKLALLPQSAVVRFATRKILPLIIGMPLFQRKLLRTLSEVTVARREIQQRSVYSKDYICL